MKTRKSTSKPFHSFLGGTLKHVIIKLLILSLLVGIAMNLLGWTPRNLVYKAIKFFKLLWETGFTTFANLFYMTAMGAIIVVPTFLLLRIFRKK